MNQYRCETCKKRLYNNPEDCPCEKEYEELLEHRVSVSDIELIMTIVGCTSHSNFQNQRGTVITEQRINYLRSLGWMVAVHNDYKQNGEFHTFWLLTCPDGRYLKGEGKTDDEALEQIVAQFHVGEGGDRDDTRICTET